METIHQQALEPELERMFLNDIRSRMASIARCIFCIEDALGQDGNTDFDALKTLMREFHTVKACADFDDITTLAHLAHAVEDLLSLLLAEQLKPNRGHLDLLYTVVDFTIQIISDFDIPEEDIQRDAESLIAATHAKVNELKAWLGERHEDGSNIHSPDTSVFLSRSRDDLDALGSVRPAHDQTAQTIELLDELRKWMTQLESRFSDMPTLAKRAADLLENLMERSAPPIGERLRHLMGELLIALKVAGRQTQRPPGCDLGILSDVTTVIRNCYANLIQGGRGELPGFEALIELITEIRWQLRVNLPGLPVFAQQDQKQTSLAVLGRHVNSLVKKAAKALGKEVSITLAIDQHAQIGQALASELDLILVHLLRNAVDHGIEMPEAREAAGKPLAGRLRFSARIMRDHLLLEIEDDGRGLQRQAIIEKAAALGLLKGGSSEDADLAAIIMDPGFSTATTPTLFSGRGMGMSIIKEHVEALGGAVRMESTEGAGTTCRITIPLAPGPDEEPAP